MTTPWPAHGREGRMWRICLGEVDGDVERVIVVGTLASGILPGGCRGYRIPPSHSSFRFIWRDALKSLGKSVDGVLFPAPSIHRLSTEDCVEALRLAGGATRPRGIVAVELLVPPRSDDDSDSPERPGVGPLIRAMEEAGLGEPRVVGDPEPGSSRMVVLARV